MKKLLQMGALLLALLLALCACTTPPATPDGEDGDETEQQETIPVLGDDGEVALESFGIQKADLSGMDFTFSDRDRDGSVPASGVTKIRFNGSSCSTSGSGVNVNNTNKSVTITTSGTYVLSGSSTEYIVYVKAADADKVQIVLDGVSLSNKRGPAIYAVNADKVFITLADQTESTLADGDNYIVVTEGTTIDAAIFSHVDLTINGSGSLTVNGNFKHGIASKDDLRITGGKITVNAYNVGLEGKDCVKIGGGDITVNAGSDGVRSNNDKDATRGFFYMEGGKLNVTAKNDAIQAQTVINLAGGELSLLAGGGRANTSTDTKSHKGLKATSDILISGGKLTVNAREDAIQSDAAVLISGGEITLTTAKDAIFAAHAIEQTGGSLTVSASYEALEARYVVLSGGSANLTSEDDAINGVADDHDAAKNPVGSAVLLSGADLCIYAGKDGVDVDGSLAITGGRVLIYGTTKDSRVFDYNSSAALTGGTFAALGGENFLKPFTGAKGQATLSCVLDPQTAKTPFTLQTESGDGILAVTSEYSYQSVLVSTPALQKASTCGIAIGGEVSGLDAGVCLLDPSLTGNSTLSTHFVSSNLFSVDLRESQALS